MPLDVYFVLTSCNCGLRSVAADALLAPAMSITNNNNVEKKTLRVCFELLCCIMSIGFVILFFWVANLIQKRRLTKKRQP